MVFIERIIKNHSMKIFALSLIGGLLLCSYVFIHPGATRGKNERLPAPTERAHHSGIYDPSHNGFVIFGGFIFKKNGPERTGDVWAWDGNNWKQIAITDTRKIIAPLAFDYKRQKLLMFGGSDTTSPEDGKLSVFENNK